MIKTKRTFGIILLLSILIGACSSKEQRQQNLIQKGYQSLDQNQERQAIDYFESAIDIDEANPSAWNGLGVAQYQDGHPYEAVLSFGKAIQYRNDYHRAYYNRSNAFYQTGEYYRALDDLEAVMPAYQDSAFAHLAKGLSLVGLKRYEPAKEAFLTALALDNENSETLTNLAAVFYYQEKYEQAYDYLNQALAINPKEANAWNLLALVQSEEQEFAKALISVNKALDIQSGQPYFLNNRGYIYTFLDKYPEAYADLRKSIVADEKNPYVYRNLGILSLKKGEFKEAIRQLENALKKNDELPSAHFYLGEAYRSDQQEEQACQAYEASAKLDDSQGKAAFKQYCSN